MLAAVGCSRHDAGQQSADQLGGPIGSRARRRRARSAALRSGAGYDAPDLWIDFKNKYPDTKASFEIGASDARRLHGKMKAGAKSDIFHAYTGWLQFYVDEGLVDEIDVVEAQRTGARCRKASAQIGQFNGKQYFVPWDWGFTSDPVSHRQGQGQDRLVERIARPEVTRATFRPGTTDPAVVTVSSYIHGYDETAITDEQLRRDQGRVDQRSVR